MMDRRTDPPGGYIPVWKAYGKQEEKCQAFPRVGESWSHHESRTFLMEVLCSETCPVTACTATVSWLESTGLWRDRGVIEAKAHRGTTIEGCGKKRPGFC